MPQFDEDLRTKPMRLSLVLDSATSAPAWVRRVIQTIRSLSFVQLESVVITESLDTPGDSYGFLYRCYLEWDRWRNKSKDDPQEIVDVTGLISGISRVSFEELEGDVVIWLAGNAPRLDWGDRSLMGLLHFVPADPLRYDGRPPYFWELFSRDPVSGSAWEILSSAEPAGAIVARGASSTVIGWSLRQNRATPYWKAAPLLQKSLHQLRIRSQPKPISKSQERICKPPTNIQVGEFIARNVYRSVQRRVAYIRREPSWFVSYRTNPSLFVSKNQSFQPHGFRVLDAPLGHFFADPFVMSRGERTFVFVEDYIYKEGKGVVSVLELGANGELGPAKQVLERPYHLSYPFVFEHGESMFMIPETLDSHRIELYEATDFPWTWKLVHLFKEDVDAVDTTLWVENGIFYFFTNIAEPGVTPNDLLYLYCSDSLLGEWHPHPANPICADVRSSRGAGCLFRRDGKLIRPAQDCSVRYGYACQLNEVEVLSPEEFRERPSTRIEPNWFPGLIGTHTINSNEAIEVIDGQVYRARNV